MILKPYERFRSLVKQGQVLKTAQRTDLVLLQSQIQLVEPCLRDKVVSKCILVEGVGHIE